MFKMTDGFDHSKAFQFSGTVVIFRKSFGKVCDDVFFSMIIFLCKYCSNANSTSISVEYARFLQIKDSQNWF